MLGLANWRMRRIEKCASWLPAQIAKPNSASFGKSVEPPGESEVARSAQGLLQELLAGKALLPHFPFSFALVGFDARFDAPFFAMFDLQSER